MNQQTTTQNQSTTPDVKPWTGFINPYNFVRYNEHVHRERPRTHEKYSGLSGKITVRLQVVTPLCIPDAEASTQVELPNALDEKGNLKKRWVKPFCRVDDKPFIPGSSLKGMLRSVAEAASNSCFTIMTEELAVFRDNRKISANYRRLGRFDKEDNRSFRIQDVHPDGGGHKNPSNPNDEPRQPVQIWNDRKALYEDNRNNLFSRSIPEKPAPANVSPSYRNKFHWYYLFKGCFGDSRRTDYGDSGQKMYDHRANPPYDHRPDPPERNPGNRVFILWPIAENKTEPTYNIHLSTIEFYQKKLIESNAFKRYHNDNVSLASWQEKYLKAIENEIYWYRIDYPTQKVIDFGRNFRYKWAYDPREALPKALHPCDRPYFLCPCCNIFGMVAEERPSQTHGGHEEAKVAAIAGKVAISPGLWQGPAPTEANFCLIEDHKILGTPKYSCRSFYLQPTSGKKAEEDNYIQIDADGKITTKPLRGRKFYWHHTQNGLQPWYHDCDNIKEYVNRRKLPKNNEPPPETDQNAKIETLMPGAQFTFTIDFENLQQWEVGLLLWSIALPDVPNGAHKLGLGKPLGLGTVKLSIERVEFINRHQRYQSLFNTGLQELSSVDCSASPLSDYIATFKRRVTQINGKVETDFDTLENIRDLCWILSQSQPAHVKKDEIPIAYPPGKHDQDEKEGESHRFEQHHVWFSNTMKWSENLLRIDEIAQGGKYQHIKPPPDQSRQADQGQRQQNRFGRNKKKNRRK